MRRAFALGLAGAALAAFAQSAQIAAFSAAPPGAMLPAGWVVRSVGRVQPARIALVEDGGRTVLEVSSRNAAGAASYALRAEPALLAWRWKIDRVVESADLSRRSGDDFAARVYVFFDEPLSALAWTDRVKIRLARLVYGEEIPIAGICYVWDNRHPVGSSAWSPYTNRIRVVVAASGTQQAGRWVEERRDLAADFRAAFGAEWPGAVPAVTGIALGNDTDQTGESATARFGDLSFEPRP